MHKVCSLKEFLTWSQTQLDVSSSHKNVRNWFRGQPNSEWDLVPGVYRPNFMEVGSDHSEKSRLHRESHLTQDFKILAAAHVPAGLGDAETYFLQQHYGMPTRLLDWTLSPLSALFFACESNLKLDGRVFYLDAFGVLPSQKIEEAGKYKGVFTSEIIEQRNFLSPIFWFLEPASFPDYIACVRPAHFNTRISLQSGCFTFHVPKKPILKEGDFNIRSATIPAEKKAVIIEELRQVGVNTFSIYGDLSSLCTSIKMNYGIT